MTERLSPENQGIRLVEADDALTVTRDRDGNVLFFVTEPKHPYETQDLFLAMRLAGDRLIDVSTSVYPQHGLNIIDDSIVIDDFETLLSQHEDLCYISIEAEPLFLRALNIAEKRLGQEHTSTIQIRHNLIFTLVSWQI